MNFRNILPLVISLLISLSAFGQKLITVENKANINIDNKFINLFEALEEKNSSFENKMIKINDPFSNSTESIYFQIDDNSMNDQLFKPMIVNYKSTEEFIWIGNSSNKLSSLIFKRDSNGYSGIYYDHLKGERYIFLPTNEEGVNFFFELKKEDFSCNQNSAISEPNVTGDYCDDDCPNNVHLLFLLAPQTQSFLINEGYAKTIIDLILAELQMVWGNSNINNTSTYDIHSYYQIIDADNDGVEDDPEVDYSCNTAVDVLSTSIIPLQLRNVYSADIVIYLDVPGFIQYSGGTYACVDEVGEDEESINDAYVIIPIENLLLNYTFVHEIGHIFGAKHNPDPAGGEEDRCGFGHILEFSNGKKRSTVLEDSSIPRIPHYSDPNINFMNVSTGSYAQSETDSDHNNAGRIREMSCIVPKYRDNFGISCSIEYSDENCLLSLAPIVDPPTPDCGDDNYSFIWNISLDGFFTEPYPGEFLSNEDFISMDQPYQDYCLTYFIELEVFACGEKQCESVITLQGDICTTPPTNGCDNEGDGNLLNEENISNNRNINHLNSPIHLYNLSGVKIGEYRDIKQIKEQNRITGIYIISYIRNGELIVEKHFFN